MTEASPFALLSSQMLSAKHVPAPSTFAQERRLNIFPSGENDQPEKRLVDTGTWVLAQSQTPINHTVFSQLAGARGDETLKGSFKHEI